MARPKGTPKTGGRRKGSKNKMTPVIKDYLKDFVEAEIKRLPDVIGLLNASDRLNFLAKVLPYVRPRKQEVDIRTEVEALLANIEYLNEPQLRRLELIIKQVIADGE